jgi:adenine C2-methylase RlmN of 23S rRNA A2503 and tRNA A37
MELDLIDSFAPNAGDTVTYTYRSRAGHALNVVVVCNDDENILHVPCQTNCAMACQFCKTTRLAGKIPVLDLRSEEIVYASDSALQLAAWEYEVNSKKPLLVSFTGCGEPLANRDEVSQAMIDLRDWAKPLRIPIRFTLATMLPKRHVSDFRWLGTEVAKNKLPVTVQFSLHFTEDAVRRRYMPSANDIRSSLGYLRWYRGLTRNPVEIGYMLISGVNDDVNSLDLLVRLMGDRKIPVKFLYFMGAPSQSLRRIDPGWIDFIRNYFAQNNVDVEFQDSPGLDVGRQLR